MDGLTHLYQQSLIPHDRFVAWSHTPPPRAERRPRRVRPRLRAAFDVLRRMSRRRTIVWMQRIEEPRIREGIR